MWLVLSPSIQLVSDSPNLTHQPTNLPTSVAISIKKLMVAHRMQKFAKFYTISHNWTPVHAFTPYLLQTHRSVMLPSPSLSPNYQ